MKVLLLSPYENGIQNFIESNGDIVYKTSGLVSMALLVRQQIDFIVSYGYRYRLSKRVLDQINYRAINLHISYLPWNRGADPNLWSAVEDTPKGVTIHYINDGFDTGDILFQKAIFFRPEDTLRTSYSTLRTTVENLFYQNWAQIRNGKLIGVKQDQTAGSYHRIQQREKIWPYLKLGWDTVLRDVPKRCL
tara:strand:- start:22152 stop:22724 length:573 start_codon:yes stop_codon:yes gene_type:complete